jgi:hypothetical protein
MNNKVQRGRSPELPLLCRPRLRLRLAEGHPLRRLQLAVAHLLRLQLAWP